MAGERYSSHKATGHARMMRQDTAQAVAEVMEDRADVTAESFPARTDDLVSRMADPDW